MNKKIKVSWTRGLIAWTIFYQFRIYLFSFLFVLVGYYLCLLITEAACNCTPFDLLRSFGFIMVFLAFAIMVPFFYYKKSMALLRKMGSSVVRYQFTEKYLSVENGLVSAKIAWKGLDSLKKNGRIWRIMASNGSYPIPVGLLDEKLKVFLSKKLRSGFALQELINGISISFVLCGSLYYFWTVFSNR